MFYGVTIDTLVTLTARPGFRSLGKRTQISINGQNADCNGTPFADVRRCRYVSLQ